MCHEGVTTIGTGGAGGRRKRMRRQSLVVTGATSPIGRAVVRWAEQSHFRVIAVTRRRCRARRLSKVTYITCDLADPTSVSDCARTICALVPKVDVLVNNASSWHRGGLLSQEPEEIREHIVVSLAGTLDFTRRLLPSLLATNGGVVVNICSTAGTQWLWSANTTYVAGKAGLAAFGQSLRRELAPVGLRVTNLHLGAVDDGDADTAGCIRTSSIVKLLSTIVRLPRDVVADAVVLTPACRIY